MDDLPVLSDSNPSTKSTALWLILIRRWANAHGIAHVVCGPIGEDTSTDDVAAGRRYVLAAIANDSLKYDLANQPDVTNGPQMLSYPHPDHFSAYSPLENPVLKV